MKIGVVSDTHNNLKNCNKIVELFNEALVDRVIHTGDITQAKTLEVLSNLRAPMWGVFGNNDLGERDSLLNAAKQFDFELPSSHNTFIYLIEGQIKVGNENHKKLEGSTLILLKRGKNLTISSMTNSKFLIISGKPIGEQIAKGGPFVMNTKAEILQAVQDYHNGTFVK